MSPVSVRCIIKVWQRPISKSERTPLPSSAIRPSAATGDYWFLAHRPNRRVTILTLLGQLIIIAKLEDDDIGAPILGMGREVAIFRCNPILVKATSNLHDLPRTVLLAPLLDQINCVREPADKGCVDHCGFPYLATARPAAAARRSGVPPQGRRGFPSARR